MRLTSRQHKDLAFFGIGVMGPCIIMAFVYLFIGYYDASVFFSGLTALVVVISILNFKASQQ